MFCYPRYKTNQTFIAPQNQDAATILCQKTINENNVGFAWSIPCNQFVECDDGRDEFECEFPPWLIPSLLSGAGVALIITLFVHLYISIRNVWKKKMQYRRSRFSIQRPNISIESEKLYKIAVLIECGDLDKIHEMYCQELENLGGEGEAVCYFKVMEHSIEPKSSFITK